jgi:hypothetical protein
MFDWIPLNIYGAIYFYILLLILLLFLSNSKSNLFSFKNSLFSNRIGVFLLFFSMMYIGFRPVSGYYFGDMSTYNSSFLKLQRGIELTASHDVFFNTFMRFCASIMTVDIFFLLISFIYIFTIYVACKRWFKGNWGYAFYILLASFSFWSYGTNGMRNGMATSLILLGFSFSNRKVFMIVFFTFAALFHKTALLPIIAFVITMFYNDSKKLMYFWLLCIPLSLVLGGAFENFIAGIGIFEDDRLSYLTDGNVNGDEFSHTGFRWDFLLYSASAVYAGYYFVFKRGFQDKIYDQLLNVYLICNAFWVLVIRANFSNRFAYLSWFMMGIVIVYPFLKGQFFRNQNVILSKVMVLYFLFTFFMNVIL